MLVKGATGVSSYIAHPFNMCNNSQTERIHRASQTNSSVEPLTHRGPVDMRKWATMQSNLCNCLANLVYVIYRCPTSKRVWDLDTSHQTSSPNNGRQGDMPRWNRRAQTKSILFTFQGISTGAHVYNSTRIYWWHYSIVGLRKISGGDIQIGNVTLVNVIVGLYTWWMGFIIG